MLPSVFSPGDPLLVELVGSGVVRTAGSEWFFGPNGLELRGKATPITFSRASQATYFDAAGNLQIAGNNVLRIDHNPATLECLGLLSGSQATNQWRYSEPESGQVLTTGTVGFDATPRRGFSKWATIGAGGNYIRSVDLPLALTGSAYTLSAFVIMDDGAGPPIIGSGAGQDIAIIVAGNASLTAFGVIDLGEGLYRIWGTRTASADTPQQQIRKYSENTSRSFKVSGLQFEAGALSSYIPTQASAAIRADDVLNVTDMSWFNPSHGVFIAKVRASPGSVIGSTRRVAVIGTGLNALRLNLGATGGWPYSEVGNGSSLSSALGAGTTVVDSAVWEYIAFSYSTTGPHCFARRRGNAAATSAIRGGDTYSGVMPTTMTVMNNANAHLAFLRFEPRLITSGAQLQAILNALPSV
jgi:hypothetical protein